MLEPRLIDCPYCGESIEVLVDASAGDQDYVEDCQVCCRPIELHVQLGADGEVVQVTPRRDDD